MPWIMRCAVTARTDLLCLWLCFPWVAFLLIFCLLSLLLAPQLSFSLCCPLWFAHLQHTVFFFSCSFRCCSHAASLHWLSAHSCLPLLPFKHKQKGGICWRQFRWTPLKLKWLKLGTVSYCCLRLQSVQMQPLVIHSNPRQEADFEKSQVRAGLENPCSSGTAVYSRVNSSLPCETELSCCTAWVWVWVGERTTGSFKRCPRQCHCGVNVAESEAENEMGLCHCMRLVSFFLLAFPACPSRMLAYSSSEQHLNTIPVQILLRINPERTAARQAFVSLLPSSKFW